MQVELEKPFDRLSKTSEGVCDLACHCQRREGGNDPQDDFFRGVFHRRITFSYVFISIRRSGLSISV